MPDLTGLPALDVAIGLSFIFFLLSLVASTLQEVIANLLSLRAKVLERGLRNMLGDKTQAPAGSAAAAAAASGPPRDLLFRVYGHPLIRSLYRESWFPLGRTTLKSADGTETPVGEAEQKLKEARQAAQDADASKRFVAAEQAKTVEAEVTAERVAAEQARPTDADADPVTEGGAGNARGVAPPQEAKVRLPSYIAPRSFALALLDTLAPDVTATDPETGLPRPNQDIIKQTRAAILAMNIPGGVKHRLLALLDDARGDIEAFRRNVEAWFDDTMARVSGWYKRRAQLIITVLAVLITAALNVNTLTISERLWRDPTLRATLVQQAGSADSAPDGDTAQAQLENAVDNVEAVAKVGVPIGWAQGSKRADDPRHIALGSVGGWGHWLGGWLLTILAVSLGAPFWFDTLSRLSRLRGTGKPETPLPASGRGQPGERVVTGTAPVNVAVQHVPAIAAVTTPPAPG